MRAKRLRYYRQAGVPRTKNIDAKWIQMYNVVLRDLERNEEI